MIRIEQLIASAIGLGLIGFAIGIRIYGAYVGMRESRRGDVAERSDMQTLFTDPTQPARQDHEEIQTLFNNKV